MFEVGQRVKVIHIREDMGTTLPLRRTLGRLGTVEKLDYLPSGAPVKVRFGPDSDFWWYYEDELKPADAS